MDLHTWNYIFEASIKFIQGNQDLVGLERSKGELEGAEKLISLHERDSKEDRIVQILYDEGKLTETGERIACFIEVIGYFSTIVKDIDLLFEFATIICQKYEVKREIGMYVIQEVQSTIPSTNRRPTRHSKEMIGDPLISSLILSLEFLCENEILEILLANKRIYRDVYTEFLKGVLRNKEMGDPIRRQVYACLTSSPVKS